MRHCKNPRYIDFLGEKLYFNPVIASNYGLHIIGLQHEPESHKFLNKLLDDLHEAKSCFIEIGANIGVFLVDIARRNNVHVFGFEPSISCVEAINKSMNVNERSNFSVFANLVGDSDKLVPFSKGVNHPRQSRGLENVSPSKGLRRLLSQPCHLCTLPTFVTNCTPHGNLKHTALNLEIDDHTWLLPFFNQLPSLNAYPILCTKQPYFSKSQTPTVTPAEPGVYPNQLIPKELRFIQAKTQVNVFCR